MASPGRGFFVLRDGNGQYQPETIEMKWQEIWEAERAFYVDPEPGTSRAEVYMSMLPYPSRTLHMGHVLNYALGRRRHALPPAQRAGTFCARSAGTRSACPPERGDPRGRPAEGDRRADIVLSAPDAPAGLGDRLDREARRTS